MDRPMKTSSLLALIAALAVSAPAFAQTSTPTTSTTMAPAATSAPATAPKSPAPTTTTGKQRTAKSLDCSKQANEKKLHGNERKTFMKECKKA